MKSHNSQPLHKFKKWLSDADANGSSCMKYDRETESMVYYPGAKVTIKMIIPAVEVRIGKLYSFEDWDVPFRDADRLNFKNNKLYFYHPNIYWDLQENLHKALFFYISKSYVYSFTFDKGTNLIDFLNKYIELELYNSDLTIKDKLALAIL